ncbi:MAG TPA: hypothetical protein VFY83_07005 [Anaerolineales bacterium]|nr:hypothetical protein [Anaerolineales bacterium]
MVEPSVLSWVENHPAASRIIPVIGNAADESVAEQAADRPQTAGSFSGWVNNAAVFHDTPIHRVPARQVLDGITLNLNLALVGCAVAYLLSDTASFINGAIVPVDGGRSVLGPDPEERDPTS